MWILILIVNVVHCIDNCIEFTNFQSCINSKLGQCRWMPTFSECIYQDNYLIGCDVTLNEKLCVKQLGTVLGELSLCIFDTQCHTIIDSSQIKCTDKVSKSGCLSISEQQCKWENNSCLSLSDNDFINLQATFMNMELSVSVCPLITGYLIMHHSLLWPINDYEPDLISESENQILEDEGQQIISTIEYSDGQMQNNYINSSGQYIWYEYKKTESITSSNLKISDQTRYGCIAIEIQSDSNFIQLFSLTGTINGVNHIYCKYLNKHPSNPQLSVFINRKCVTVTLNQLTSNDFISQNQISCYSLGTITCQRLRVSNLKCMRYEKNQYECIPYQETLLNQNLNCDTNNGIATYNSCLQSNYCFLNTLQSSAFCDNSCYTYKLSETNCLSQNQCLWSGVSSLDETSVLIHCFPYDKCNTLGLSKLYCIQMASECYWNEDLTQCEDSKGIAFITCEQANTIYTCTSITRSDQHCIWYNNKCINVIDQPLLSYFKSLPQGVMMNRITCMSMQSEYYYYFQSTRMCLQTKEITMRCLDKSLDTYKSDKIISDLPCTNTAAQNISKYFCLNLYNSNVRWDQYSQKCLSLSDSQLKADCQTFKLVNPRVCSQTLYSDLFYCLYDSELQMCYLQKKDEHNLTCKDKGLNKQLCTSISTQGEFCKWSYGNCKQLIYKDINLQQCNSLLQVNGNSCSYFISDVGCVYDPEYLSCATAYLSEKTCNNHLNPVACQNSQSSCYFDFVIYQCLDTTTEILSKIKCNGSYLSESACKQITTANQFCIFNGECQSYVDQFLVTCNSYDSANQAACSHFQSNFVNFFLNGSYCELIDGECTATMDIIPDCGQDRQINIHRCVAQTTGLCYYDSYQCLEVQDDDYLTLLLSQVDCTQVNLSLCGRVTTQQQTCWIVDNNQNVKCSYYKSGKTYSCSDLQQINFSNQMKTVQGKRQWFNRNMCQLATDSCYFDVNLSTCVQDLNAQFKCDHIGLSMTFCLYQTIGACVYSNRTCQYIQDYTISCEYRNIEACSFGSQQCIWDTMNSKCTYRSEGCPSTYDNISWMSCGYNDNDSCFAYKNGCSTLDIPVKPCFIGLSYGECISQNHMCFWINERCMAYDESFFSCENSQTLNACMINANQNEYCAYQNNKCFPIDINNSSCDQYAQVSFYFCTQFPDCVYDTTNNQCLNFKRSQFEETNIFNIKSYLQNLCYSLENMTCLYQKQYLCQYSDEYCEPFSDEQYDSCPYNLDELYGYSLSYASCFQYDNCYTLVTRDAQISLCYQDQIDCSQLNETYCLYDFQSLLCTYDYDQSLCKNLELNISCSDIQGLYINQQACIQANKNDDLQCYYDNSTNKCKMLELNEPDTCEQIDILYQDSFSQEINCTFTKLKCYIIYNQQGNYQQCSSVIEGNLNMNNCLSQINAPYMFDLNTYTCIIVTSLTNIYLCDFLNEQACLNYTNQFQLKCIWNDIDNKCRSMLLTDQSSVICKNRNKNSCQLTQNLLCVYKDNQCQDYNDTLNCNTLISQSQLVSPLVCQNAGCLFNGVNCIQINIEPSHYFTCSNLGLNRQQCLEKTNTNTCYWNGIHCDDANLVLQKCSDDVSQNTCLALVGYEQFCKWIDNTCIQINNTQDQCSIYSNLNNGNACKSQNNIQCYYDSNLNECRDIEQIYEDCNDGLSVLACQSVINNFCTITSDGTCSTLDYYSLQCESVRNKHGCYYFKQSCIWKDNSCKQLKDYYACNQMPIGANKYSCIYQSKPISGIDNCDQCNCTFNDDTLRCSYELSGLKIQNFEQINQNGYVQSKLSDDCISAQNLFDCIGNRVGKCKWNDQKCQVSDFIGCQNQNIWACVEVIDSYCLWRDDTCVVYNNNKFEVQLVTQNVCKLLDQSLNARYDSTLHSCVTNELTNCNLLSVTIQTCLQNTIQACTYVNEECIDFVFIQYGSCNNYQNVSYVACQQIQNLACKYSNYQCIDVDVSDNCTTQGLSKLGCLQITQQACYWDGLQCQKFELNTYIDQCDSVSLVNSLSCGLINYGQQPCTYDQKHHVCTHKFNAQSSCNTPGINETGCYLLETEPCQYKYGRCQTFTIGDYWCFQVTNVNSFSCQILKMDNCAYEVSTHSCYSVLNFVECNTLGINENGCALLNNCSYINDYQKCQCNQIDYNDKCYNSTKDNCITNSSICYWKDGDCIIRRCKHLDQSQCNGVINGEQCYIDQQNECQGAKQCEDIIYTDQDCSQFIFQNSNCIQMSNYCVSATNFKEICINSNCSNNVCVIDTGVCRPLQCSDYNEDDCFKSQGCAYIQNECVEIQSCNEITDSTICNKVTIDNKMCSWEEFSLLDTTKICTNSQCQLFMPAYDICNGNEINGKTCILTKLIKCISCEEVTDMCTCNESNNACTWINNECISIFCVSFNSESLCNNSNRCYWSSQDQVCRKMCIQNIRQDQCESVIYECHWNPYMRLCEQGIEVIPDLSIDIEVDELSQLLLFINLLFMIL